MLMDGVSSETREEQHSKQGFPDMALLKFLVTPCRITEMVTACLTLGKTQDTVSDQNLILVTPACTGIESLTPVKSFWTFIHTLGVLLSSKQPKRQIATSI